jgi:RNA polymerase sigma factor (sigma-70 family)
MSPRISIRLLAAQSDQRLLALVRDGHERAFEALVRRYRRPLLHYCRRTMHLSDTRAEDVLQHAMLQAWLALARGSEVRDLKPWLYRIVHNAAINAIRGPAEGHAELTEAVHARAAVAGGESDLDRRIAVREALTNVASLPQMQRQAIFLSAVDGQSHDEVAAALGISQGAVRGLLYRARATLRSAAAALTPQPLIEWASGGAGASAPTAERLAELSAGGGAVGVTAMLVKGAVVVVTAGALATGATLAHRHHHSAPRQSARAASLAPVGTPQSAGTEGSAATAGGLASASSPSAQVRRRVGGFAHRGTSTGVPDGRAFQGNTPGRVLIGERTAAQSAPALPRGDAQEGGGGPAPRPASGGDGSPSGAGGRLGHDQGGDGGEHSGPSINGSSGGGSAPAEAGSDGSAAGAAKSPPGGQDGQSGQNSTTADRSGGDNTSAAGLEPTGGS